MVAVGVKRRHPGEKVCMESVVWPPCGAQEPLIQDIQVSLRIVFHGESLHMSENLFQLYYALQYQGKVRETTQKIVDSYIRH